MKKEKMEKLQQLASTPEIQQKMEALKSEGEMTGARIIDFWKAQGIELTEDDLKAPSHEMSDDELEAVSGGGGCGCCGTGGGWGDMMRCMCILSGGGGIDYRTSSGELKEGIDCRFSKYGNCMCLGAGAGATNWGDVTPHILEPGEYGGS